MNYKVKKIETFKNIKTFEFSGEDNYDRNVCAYSKIDF